MEATKEHLLHVDSGDLLYGSVLEAGDVLQIGDVYEHPNGKWEACPYALKDFELRESDVKSMRWVRSTK